MKGKSIRRRLKNSLAAKSANLYKAQFGKATKWDALPPPPEEQAQYADLPRSTRKVMEFMRQQSGSEASTSQHIQWQPAKKPKNKFKAAPQSEAQSGRPLSAVDGQSAGIVDAGNVMELAQAAQRPQTTGPTPQPVAKGQKTRAKRKEVLNTKKRLKKLKRQVAQAAVTGDDEQTEGGLQREHVAFGEVAHAPPKATLKRRHWDEAQAAAAHQARHKEVLLKHLRKGEARQADPEASLHASLQAQRDQVVRDRVQGAYRKMKGSRMEGANMHSLKQLVHRRHD